MPLSADSIPRGLVAVYAVFAGLALTRLRLGVEVLAPVMIASGFALMAVRQYLLVRAIPLGGRLHSQWISTLQYVGLTLVALGLAVRYLR